MKKTKIHKFNNGLVLIYEKNKVSKLDSFQINVKTGSILEKENEKGINHLVEHLMFKSTKTRTTEEIATQLEVMGANINAYTSYSNVCYGFDILSEKLEKSAEIYSDMLFNKNITKDEFLMEKEVVCQEIAMGKDMPSISNGRNWYKTFFGWDDIAGTIKSVKKITLAQVNRFINNYYTPKNMILSVCSKLSFNKIKRIVNKNFGQDNINDFVNLDMLWAESKNANTTPVYKNKIQLKKEKTAQVQIIHGYNASDLTDIQLQFCSDVLSAGLSSLLVREVREKQGLCYSIGSCFYNFENKTILDNYNKLFLIMSSTEKQNIERYKKVLSTTIADIKNIVTEEDIVRVKNKYKSSSEQASLCAVFNYINYTEFNKRTMTYLNAIKEVYDYTLQDVIRVLDKIFHNKPYSCSMLGDCK